MCGVYLKIHHTGNKPYIEFDTMKLDMLYFTAECLLINSSACWTCTRKTAHVPLYRNYKYFRYSALLLILSVFVCSRNHVKVNYLLWLKLAFKLSFIFSFLLIFNALRLYIKHQYFTIIMCSLYTFCSF